MHFSINTTPHKTLYIFYLISILITTTASTQVGVMALYVSNAFSILIQDCSKITANLVNYKLGIKNEYLCSLPMNEPVTIGEVKVTLLGTFFFWV